MEFLRFIVKEALPGSLPFLLLGMSLGVGLLFGPARAARWGRRWLAALLCLYVALSIEGTRDLLVAGLSRGYQSVGTVDEAGQARILVVLSNGTQTLRERGQELSIVNAPTGYNALEAARLYRLLGDPLVLVSGGYGGGRRRGQPESETLAAAIEQYGVPRARMVLESQSRTTYEQAVNVAQWLRMNGDSRFILITAPTHMRRALAAFEALGLHPVPSVGYSPAGTAFWELNETALRGSTTAIYEYLALVFYRARGWV